MIDELNRKIVELILRGLTQTEISERLQISLKTVQNRIKKLEDDGFLIKLKEGYWVADYKKLGLEMLSVNFIDFDLSCKNRLKEVIDLLKRLDFVENVFEIVGSPYDLCFIVRYKSLDEYMEERGKFFRWLEKKGFRINHYEAFIASKTHKDHRRTIL
jgi:DNA-binding Lrp family transcriptional regulator